MIYQKHSCKITKWTQLTHGLFLQWKIHLLEVVIVKVPLAKDQTISR